MIGVIGGGIAGTALVKVLSDNNENFLWIKNNEISASHISSGIINPITGRRYALAWKYDEMSALSVKFYGDFIKPIVIEKQFTPHNGELEIEAVVKEKEAYLSIKGENWIIIKDSYQVDVPSFLEYYQQLYAHTSNVLIENFDFKVLTSMGSQWNYKGHILDKIIFAEGIHVTENPYFNYLNFIPNRGEAITIDIENYKLEVVKKHGKFICNFKNGFWVGSSFGKIGLDAPLKTKEMYDELVATIPLLIGDRPYEVKEHLGAFRSTTYDRRPYVGEHPEHKNLYIFNGFGTKGASLIPYCAYELYHHLKNDKEMDAEISVHRTAKKR